VAVIEAGEILAETRARTEAGEGVCVGRPVAGVEVAVLPISDEPITAWDEGLRRPPGEVGEIAVRGALVTRRYWNRAPATAAAKIPGPGGTVWHRMGDLGRLDGQGRLWFCGRKSQRVVVTGGRTLCTDASEAVFAAHPQVRRAALVGVRGHPVLCVELEPAGRRRKRQELVGELLALGARVAQTADIRTILFHPRFPVDIRHNAKIGREALAVWAERRLR
jgi:acyl-CoA synthetase (AMP-forming)/AMP-acid ligase II